MYINICMEYQGFARNLKAKRILSLELLKTVFYSTLFITTTTTAGPLVDVVRNVDSVEAPRHSS